MTDKQLDILVNIIGGVESGGQVYGNRRYDAYAAPYANSPNEHTITLGWCQFYGYNARELCQRIFNADKTLFRKNDTANIEKRLSQDWVAMRWKPTSAEKSALLKIITTDVGKKMQDDMFKEDMVLFIKDAESFGISDIGAQMMYCEIRHLGDKSPVERIFNRAKKPYTAETVYASLLLDQNDTSNSNQVGDKKYQSRHDCCLEWIKTYVYGDTNNENKEGDKPMNINEAIQKVIKIAEGEVGYLEKKSNSQLDSKTANAGSKNYTKYWRDVYPSFQGQAWCAAWVSWILMQAFGKDMATKLLKHWPFVYCPTLGYLFTKNANPKVGDIVLFYRNGTFAHTGIVVEVQGDKFWTIEGNASGASGITPNGGGVVKKSYYNSQLPGTKFCTPDWSLVANIKSDVTSTSKQSNSSTSSTLNETEKWKGVINAKAAVRTWAGTNYNECSFSPLKKGDKVSVLDTVKASKGADWYYIRFNGKTGFTHSKFVSEATQDAPESIPENNPTSSPSKSKFPYMVKITASVLNIRKDATVDSKDVGDVRKGECYTIVEEKNGFGKLKSGAGWISLEYVEKI